MSYEGGKTCKNVRTFQNSILKRGQCVKTKVKYVWNILPLGYTISEKIWKFYTYKSMWVNFDPGAISDRLQLDFVFITNIYICVLQFLTRICFTNVKSFSHVSQCINMLSPCQLWPRVMIWSNMVDVKLKDYGIWQKYFTFNSYKTLWKIKLTLDETSFDPEAMIWIN